MDGLVVVAAVSLAVPASEESRMLGCLALIALGGLTAAPSATPPPRRGETLLQYGDGKADDRRSIAGSGHAIRFERPGEAFTVTAVQIHGARYGGNYDPFLAPARISLCDERMVPFAEACVALEAWEHGRADWVDVPIGPVRVPQRFYALVEFFPSATKGVYLSIDSASEGHSLAATAGASGAPLDAGDWMVRIAGTDREVKIEVPDGAGAEVLALGEGEQLGRQSVAGNGHAVSFRRARKHSLLTSVALHGQRYGGGYDPERTPFQVFVCDKQLKVLARSLHAYALFPADAPAWIEIALPPVEVPAEFAVVAFFDPTATQGIYLGKWSEKKAASLLGLPGHGSAKLPKGEGWMLRATVCASAGKEALPEAATAAADSGPGALEIAEIAHQVDEAESREDVTAANDLVASLTGTAPQDAARLGRFTLSEHFLLRQRGLSEEQETALLALMECGRSVLSERFGFGRIGPFPERRIHLDVTIAEDLETSLFTDPRSEGFARIVLRGPAHALAAPAAGGPHVVYGFCHELGHVVAAWADDPHQWAHYVGSVLASAVHEQLGDAGWCDPYDYATLEGLPRFLAELEQEDAARAEERRVARIFHRVGAEFGLDAYARALAWIHEHREGRAFGVYREYRLGDLRDALIATGAEREAVARIFGAA